MSEEIRPLDADLLEVIYTNQDNDLYSLSNEHKVLLVFLRHFGCTFCREALTDLVECNPKLKSLGIKLVLVHMAETEVADEYINNYNLSGTEHISDPDLSLYEYFGVFQGSFWQLYGLKTWVRGFQLSHMGLATGDELGNVKQMPGVFLVHQDKIIRSFVHKSAADRPDYLAIAKGDCCTTPSSS